MIVVVRGDSFKMLLFSLAYRLGGLWFDCDEKLGK